ncbi:DUF2199 domain-containing protein, partial [Streptomyces sp. NPDC058527]|uniref:DUF2199 domain-containing protein n=1 Tax=Streptomyces sp. NPDC058527 TaxID=3346539 RepID=UPI003654C116
CVVCFFFFNTHPPTPLPAPSTPSPAPPDLWDTPGREAEPPYFGWLTTDLPIYAPTTLNLKTHVHTRPVGERPYVELEATDHPLAVEQRTGITPDRVREIAAAVLHPGDQR